MHSLINRRVQLVAVAITCLGIGAGASAVTTASANNTAARPGTHGRPLRALLRRTVAGSFVVATKSGFVDLTVARGRVQAVDPQARTLTLVEGTRSQAYRTVTLTLPTDVKVRVDRTPASLDQVAVGQRATVVTGPKRTLVLAHTPTGP